MRRSTPPRQRSDRRSPESRPLPDIVGPHMRVLFVGINPGLRSAALGHHFAGHSNRFWRLLQDAGLVPERLSFADDRRLLEWGYGLTNLAGRATAGVNDLTHDELRRGRGTLIAKVRRWRPAVVALVGVTVYRALFPAAAARAAYVGEAAERFGGARVFVLPNPSGRNAHYSYARMLEIYRALADASKTGSG